MNYYLILETMNERYDGTTNYYGISNFLLETENELKSVNPEWKNVVYSDYEKDDESYSEYEFTKISSLVFEELKKDFTVRNTL